MKWLAMLLFTMAGAAAGAAEGEPRVQRALALARRHADLGANRSAAAMLQEELARLTPEAPLTSGYHELSSLLADIYYRSEAYDLAIQVGRGCIEYLQRQRRLSADRDTGPAQCEMAVLLGECYLGRLEPAGDWERAERILGDAYILAREIDDSSILLRVLEARAKSARCAPPSRFELHRVEQRTADFTRHVMTMARQYDRGSLPAEGFSLAVQALARNHAASPPDRQAAQQLRDLAARLDTPPPLAIELWEQLAEAASRGEDHTWQVEAWREVLRHHATLPLQRTGKRAMAEAEFQVDEAEYRLRLAQALRGARPGTGRLPHEGDHEALALLDASRGLYQQALIRLRGSEADAADDVLSVALTAKVVRGLLDVDEETLSLHRRQELLRKESPLEAACSLHRYGNELLLHCDPKLYRLKTGLGARYLRHAQLDAGRLPEARKCLEEAKQFFEAHRPPDHSMQVQVLALLSELERVEGSFQEAWRLLEEAVRVYSEHLGSDVRLGLTVTLYRGRLFASTGRYSLAKDAFEQVIEQLEATSPDDELLSTARLNLGTLCTCVGHLDQSRAHCREALDLCLRRLPDGHPDLLPYRVALADVLLAIQMSVPDSLRSRDSGQMSKELQDQVDRAITICEENSLPPSRYTAAAHHHKAMLHFMTFTGRNPLHDSGNLDDVLAAEQVWGPLGELQEAKCWQTDLAKTLYYLSRIKFLRWCSSAARERDRQRVEGAGSAEADRVQNYVEGKRALANRMEAYQTRLRAYEDDVTNLQKSIADFQENRVASRRQEKLDMLESTRRSLTRTKGELVWELEEIKNLHREVDRQYAGLSRVLRRRDPTDPTEAPATGPAKADVPEQALLDEAEQLAQEAVGMLSQVDLYPNLQFMALCNYAEILNASGRRAEAVRQLTEAVKLIELPRSWMFGEEIARAEYFVRYRTAFDLLVAWLVEAERGEEALAYAEMRKNRTLLDQIVREGVRFSGGRETPDGPRGRQQRDIMSRLDATSTELRTLTELPPARRQSQEDRITVLRHQLRQLRSQAARIARRTLEENRALQNVMGQHLEPEDVKTAVRTWIQTAPPSLYYYLGPLESCVFVIGFERGQVEVVPLEQREGSGSGTDGRLPAGVIRDSVDLYVEALKTPDNRSAVTRLSQVPCCWIGNSLIPESILARLQDLRKRDVPHVLIFPDGALYQLPFEALVVGQSPSKGFLLDEVEPPFCYVPSILTLNALNGRTSLAGHRDLCGISLAKRDFSDVLPERSRAAQRFLRLQQALASPDHTETAGAEPPGVSQRAPSQPPGKPDFVALASLPGTTDESQGIQGAFGDLLPWHPLAAENATEGHLRRAIARAVPIYLHVATHGLVVEDQAGLDAALVLTMPERQTRDALDDGFLQRKEIYDLGLAGCELVALSACKTHLGAERPMEMGASLSRAFLAAGARRVLCTHWSVDDRSSATLMTAFFREIARARRENEPCDYALALERARQALRKADRGRGDDPCFWAPFVLIGPADELPASTSPLPGNALGAAR